MNKYAVGISDMSEDIEVLILETSDGMDAVCLAIKQKYQWDIKNEDDFAEVECLDDLLTLALQGDVLVSKPVLI